MAPPAQTAPRLVEVRFDIHFTHGKLTLHPPVPEVLILHKRSLMIRAPRPDWDMSWPVWYPNPHASPESVDNYKKSAKTVFDQVLDLPEVTKAFHRMSTRKCPRCGGASRPGSAKPVTITKDHLYLRDEPFVAAALLARCGTPKCAALAGDWKHATPQENYDLQKWLDYIEAGKPVERPMPRCEICNRTWGDKVDKDKGEEEIDLECCERCEGVWWCKKACAIPGWRYGHDEGCGSGKKKWLEAAKRRSSGVFGRQPGRL
jgi:hypothetical protein